MADIERDEDDGETAEGGPGIDDDALLRRLKRMERLARNHWSEWRDECRLVYDFRAGRQWTSEDKAMLLDQMRQPVTFNRVDPMCDAVIGAEILNRQETRYSPREQGDVQVNEIITAADQWARELADTEDEESDAFSDLITCGMGWTETLMDYGEDPEGRLVDDRIDPLEMWSDPQATKRNLADARYLVRARWRDKADLPKKWKGKLPSVTDGPGLIDEVHTGWTGPRDDYEREESSAKEPEAADKKRVWIRHVQWYDKEPAWRLADPMSGEVITVDKKQLKQMGEMFLMQGMRPPKAVKIDQNKYYEAFLAGDVILEKGPIEANAFTFKCMTGKRDRNKNIFYGVVRSMIDPQMWGNKFFVQIMHIINTAAKGGLMYEEDTFVNERKALEDWSKPDAALKVKRGALANNAVMERESKNYPQGIDRLMEFVFTQMPQTSGINLEMLGLVDREQPGVLETQRKKAGYAILAVFFDALRRYRKMKGRLRLYFIQNYISDGRLIRIKGKDSTEQYVPLVKQPGTATYDVIVDEAPMSPNQKEATWQMMMGLMPMLSKLDVPPEVWSVMLEHSPLPSTVSGKINEIISQQAQQPPPPDPDVQKAEMQMKLMQAKGQQDAQGKQQDLQNDQTRMQMEGAREQQKMEHERQMQELEMEGKREELALQREKQGIDRQNMREKAAIDMTVARHKQAVAMKPKPQPARASA